MAKPTSRPALVKPDDISAAYRLPVKKEKQGNDACRLCEEFTKHKLKEKFMQTEPKNQFIPTFRIQFVC